MLQETFFEVCRSIGRYREEGSLWGWIRTIAASKALMRLRRNKYRETDELHDEAVGHRREDTHLRMDLEAALERLSETSRAVVWLHDVEGYTHEEIAGMMGKTPSFSKSQLSRAHARLRGLARGGGGSMTHLSMDALVSLREPGSEPGDAAAQEHLNQCPYCQAELQRLHQRVARLKALPALRPGRDRWPETKARFTAERRRRRVRVLGLSGLAMAASVALALAVGNLSRPADATAEQLSQAMERSQVLESALSEYNPGAGCSTAGPPGSRGSWRSG